MSGRRAYIDWARGLAVLLMIEAHTSDAWTRVADRNTAAFEWLTILGGFAAPLFLWLAGLGSAISAARTESRTGSRRQAVEALCRRGLEIVLLAFLFRLQAFLITPGSRPIALLRVDVLNVMGLAIVAAAVAWGVTGRLAARVAILAAFATAVAMITPVVRAAPVVDRLPAVVQWYLRPQGAQTTFTLFPWAGFVFAGAAAGSILTSARTWTRERSAQTALGAAAAVLVGLGFYASTRPSIYAASSFWTSSPAWFAIRVGIVMGGLASLAAVQSLGPIALVARILAPLQRLGQASLFVYWIHVELVYGYASWLWRRSLPIWGTVCAYAAFSGLMYGAVVARDRYRARKSDVFVGSPAVPQA